MPSHPHVRARLLPARSRSAARIAALLTGVAALAASSVALVAPHASPTPGRTRERTLERTLDVVATEFALHAPDTITAGRARLRLTNRGREMHILEIARLADGHTAEELAAHLAARRPAPAWATFVGGPLARPAGPPAARGRTMDDPAADLAVTVDLEPGRYALLCPIPSPDDHRPHMVKGMVRTLVVTAAHRARRSPSTLPVRREHASRGPGPDRMRAARVVLDDFGFILDPAWRAGRHTVRVENRAAQPHELVLFRLDAGKRAADVVRWAGSPTGPPPGRLVAGTTALGRGRAATLDLTLTRGAYALLCFLPDVEDGRSHVRHGMTRELTID